MSLSQMKRGIRKISHNPWKIFGYLIEFGFLNQLTDEQCVRLIYRAAFNGKKLDLDAPKTFNEKLQWLKLHDRKPQYSRMVDKYESKFFIAERIGEEYVIPTLGVWDTFDDIDINSLPNQFVLKCTHDSGGLVVCRDKGSLNIGEAKAKIEKSLKTNYFLKGREWPYKNVKPRIIAEPLVHNSDYSMLEEYNIFCINGEPRFFMYCHGDKDKGETRYNDYFLMDGTWLPLKWGNPSTPSAHFVPFAAFDDMVEKSRLLSKGIPFLRVDFYLADGKPLMGELTFYNWGGTTPIEPPEYDEMFGDMLQLPDSY